MFGDPEFFDIKTSKEMGIWPDGNQISASIIPYIKRMREEKPTVLLYGILKGDDIIDILEKTNAVIFGYEQFQQPTDKTRQYVETRNKNMQEYETLCRGRFNMIDDVSKYSKYFNVVLVNMNDCLFFDLKAAYDTVKTNGIFGGNCHDIDRGKNTLKNFRRENKIGTPINVAKNTIWFWYKR